MVRKTLALDPLIQQKFTAVNKPVQPNANFANALDGKIEESNLHFSAHAMRRLKSRNINLSENDLSRLNQATERAEAKGLKEPLLLMDDLGLIVNVKNRTVLTAMDRGSMKDGVFTNIDGAVIVDAV